MQPRPIIGWAGANHRDSFGKRPRSKPLYPQAIQRVLRELSTPIAEEIFNIDSGLLRTSSQQTDHPVPMNMQAPPLDLSPETSTDLFAGLSTACTKKWSGAGTWRAQDTRKKAFRSPVRSHWTLARPLRQWGSLPENVILLTRCRRSYGLCCLGYL